MPPARKALPTPAAAASSTPPPRHPPRQPLPVSRSFPVSQTANSVWSRCRFAGRGSSTCAITRSWRGRSMCCSRHTTTGTVRGRRPCSRCSGSSTRVPITSPRSTRHPAAHPAASRTATRAAAMPLTPSTRRPPFDSPSTGAFTGTSGSTAPWTSPTCPPTPSDNQLHRDASDQMSRVVLGTV